MKQVLVWDWPVRLCHWLMAILFIGLIVTGKSEEDLIQWHFYLGYTLSGVIIIRVLYGFMGSYYAQFLRAGESIRRIPNYLSAIISGHPPKEAGHNPLGWLMVIALLGGLTIQIISGLFFSDDLFWYGPFYDHASEDWLERFASIHRILPNVLLLLVFLHLGAVLLHELKFKERLIMAMLHGKKHIPLDASIAEVRTPRIGAVLSLLVSMGWLAWLFMYNL